MTEFHTTSIEELRQERGHHRKPVTREIAEQVWRDYYASPSPDPIEALRQAIERSGIATSAREDEALEGALNTIDIARGHSRIVEAERDEWKARAETAEAKLAAAQHQAPDVGAVQLEGVNSQVLLAAAELDDKQKREPEWLWHRFDDNSTSYGRWPRPAELAPYVRADLVASVLARRQALGAAQQGEWTEEKVKRACIAYNDTFQDVDDYQGFEGSVAEHCWNAALHAAQITAPAVEGEKIDSVTGVYSGEVIASTAETETTPLGEKASILEPPATRQFTRAQEADALLKALLDYTAGFYGVAINYGIPVKETADAVQHMERAARQLHALVCEAAPSPDPLPVEQIAAVLELHQQMFEELKWLKGANISLLGKEARAALDRMKEGV